MLRFKTFGSARAAVRYYVEHGADCATLEPVAGPDRSGAARAVDYYQGSERVAGQWFGSGARAMGLSGPIRAGQVELLEGLLDGRLPDGTVVGAPVWRPHPDSRLAVGPLLDAVGELAADRGITVEAIVDDPKARGELVRLSARLARDPKAVAGVEALTMVATAAGVDVNTIYGAGRVAVAHAQSEVQVDARRAGADGAVSAPKSVSVLWAFADPAVSAEVLAAHRTAVTESVGFLERWAGHALRGHQGDGQRAAHQPTDGLVVAGFEHLTSRADDPQLHTHLVIANLLHGHDGKWSALDTRALFRAQRTAGYLYQAVLRGELTARLGVQWGPVRNGMAEITGIPDRLRKEFSTRRAQIDAHLQRTGQRGVGAAQVACLATRPAKTGRAVSELIDGWRTRAAALVGDPRRLAAAVIGRRRASPLGAVTITAVTDRLFGPEGVTARASSFDRAELTRALLETLPAGTPLTHRQVEAVVDRLATDPRALPLVDGGEVRRWTTVELASTELDTLRLAEQPTRVPTIEPADDDAWLSTEQQLTFTAIALSSASVDVVLGPAGAGKTAMLTALHEHYRSLGVPVLGACVAAVAARRLEHATAIPSTSIARLTARIRAGQQLPDGCVLVVDEAGMVGTRDYHQLTAAVTAAGGKMVPVGDRAQLTEIDAGGMFARLSRTHLRAELTDNHRQRQRWERAALTLLRTGDVPRALALYQRYRRLHHHPDHDHVALAIAGRYLDAIQQGTPVAEVVALAATRSGAATLNHAIRTRLQAAGRIGPDQAAGESSFAAGELVMITRNDYQRGLLNGQRATVTRVDPGQVTLDVDGQQHTVPAGWANERLAGAYAITVHKAQGLTVDIALVDTAGLGDRNTGYVAFSRARHRTEIHHTSRRQLINVLADDPFREPPQRTYGTTAELTTQISRHREQQLAVEQHVLRNHEPSGRYLGRER